jgi:hypothetical protein
MHTFGQRLELSMAELLPIYREQSQARSIPDFWYTVFGPTAYDIWCGVGVAVRTGIYTIPKWYDSHHPIKSIPTYRLFPIVLD